MTETLFDIAELVQPDYAPELTIQQKYEAWIASNSWVLVVMENLVGDLIRAGHNRVGIKQCWEVLRYQYGRTTGDRFKANNDWTSRVARDLIAMHPEWAQHIETRLLRAA